MDSIFHVYREGGNMDSFVMLIIVLLTYFMFFCLSMSCRQITMLCGFGAVSCIIYGLKFNFSEGIILLICGLIIIILGTLYLYIKIRHDIDFDQPIFSIKFIKFIFKLVRYCKKNKNVMLDEEADDNNEQEENNDLFYRFKRIDNLIFIVEKAGCTVINIDSGEMIKKEDLWDIPDKYIDEFVEFLSFREMYMK